MNVWCYHCSNTEIPKKVPLTPKEQKCMEDGKWFDRSLLKSLYPVLVPKSVYFCPVCGSNCESANSDPIKAI